SKAALGYSMVQAKGVSDQVFKITPSTSRSGKRGGGLAQQMHINKPTSKPKTRK
ncbi:hypothetical protein KI387_040386, partial [Taxus chinensis]